MLQCIDSPSQPDVFATKKTWDKQYSSIEGKRRGGGAVVGVGLGGCSGGLELVKW